jgi:predicted AAA+ superfamily ATPase
MLERLMTTKLDNWKENNKKYFFILDGARQTGKTYLLNNYCKNNFSSYLYVDLINEKDKLKLLQTASSVSDYLNYFDVIANEQLEHGETVIFLDNIQVFPEVLVNIKSLVIDGSFRYILAGCCLDFTCKAANFLPLGYYEIHTMYPLNFKEFLIANGVSSNVLGIVGKSLRDFTPIQEIYYLFFEKYFKAYLITGGMPAVVVSYVENENYLKALEIQKRIIAHYHSEIANYQGKNKQPLLIKLYSSIPSQLFKTYNRFFLNELKDNCRYNFKEEESCY